MISFASGRRFASMFNLIINIRGKVYKTGYRYFLKQKASQLKIRGFVSYNEDGSVNVMATGGKPEMDEFIRQFSNGNKDSLIEDVKIKQIPLQKYTSFEVLDNVQNLSMK